MMDKAAASPPGVCSPQAKVVTNRVCSSSGDTDVNLADAESLMVELAAPISGAHVEVGTTNRRRFNDAYLKLTSLVDPKAYAIVSTPGIGTYELEIAGGFHTGNADDQASDEFVREYIERYVRAATAYLDGRWSIRKSRLLRTPILTVRTDDGPLNLAPKGHWSINK